MAKRAARMRWVFFILKSEAQRIGSFDGLQDRRRP